MAANAFVKFKPRNLDRYPRLDTVLMVEQALYENRSDKTSTEIWRALPKKVLWTTYTTILDYLEYSGKIRVEPDKTVTWLWDPAGIMELKKKGLIICENELETKESRVRGRASAGRVKSAETGPVASKAGIAEEALLREFTVLAEKKGVTKEEIVKAVKRIGKRLYAEESDE
jgi:hypothetical protein